MFLLGVLQYYLFIILYYIALRITEFSSENFDYNLCTTLLVLALINLCYFVGSVLQSVSMYYSLNHELIQLSQPKASGCST